MIENRTDWHEDESLFHGAVSRVMGTRLEALIVHSDTDMLPGLWRDMVSLLESMDRIFDRFVPESEVSGINARSQDAVDISPVMEDALRLCGDYYERTLHLFDVTLGHFRDVTVGAGKVIFRNPMVRLDFGGFAKGYALRSVRRFLAANGVKNAFVDFGGSSIIGMGHHPYGDCWKVGFDSPETGVRLRDFRLYDSSLSTSGNTPSYSGHIVNPLTGVANRRKMAATVVAGDSLDAEVLSTVWMIASPEQRRQIAELSADVEANIYEL